MKSSCIQDFCLNVSFLTLLFTGIPLDTMYEMEKGHKVAGTLSPLIPNSRIENAAVL